MARSVTVRSHPQITGSRNCECISSFDRRSLHNLWHTAFLSKHPLIQPQKRELWQWSFVQVTTGLTAEVSVQFCIPERWSVTTRNLVSGGRVDTNTQFHQKRNIISNMAFPCWYSFHIAGFLPVSSIVPANYKVLWLCVTHVNVKVVFWHQIHIMENETVPVFFF